MCLLCETRLQSLIDSLAESAADFSSPAGGLVAAQSTVTPPSAEVLALTGNSWLSRWNTEAPLGTSVIVTFSFGTAKAAYDATARPGFAAYSEQQKVYARQAFDTWGAVSGIKFIEVPEALGGQIRLNMYDMAGMVNSVGNPLSGFGYFPGFQSTTIGGVTKYSVPVNSIGGDLFMNSAFYAGNDLQFQPGQRGYSILLHEIGHTIGFKHPFEGTPVINPAFDSGAYTVMSYNRSNSTTALGTIDVQAARFYYGLDAGSYTFDNVNYILTRTGGGADDWLLGTELKDKLLGGLGNDTLSSGLGADTLEGGDGNDSIDAGAGDDIIILGAGVDTINGGEGIDVADYRAFAGAVSVNLLPGLLPAGDAFGNILNAIENVLGSDFNDSIIGSAGGNLLEGFGGNDTLDGSFGTDTMIGGLGDDLFVVDTLSDVITEIFGGGTDTIRTTLSSYTLPYYVENLTLVGTGYSTGLGTALDNVIAGSAGNNALYGYDGNDTIDGAGGSDFIIGGAGNNSLNGGAGVDSIYGDAGFDTANGGTEADFIYGYGGNDVLNGDDGDDWLIAGADNDSLTGGAGIDRLYGDAGNDTLVGGADQDLMYGGDNDDLIIDTAGNNWLLGENGNDSLTGGANYDNLEGGAGNDTLNGGADQDILRGGADNDVLTDVLGNNWFFGDGGADSMTGGAGYENFDGGDGNDTMAGGGDLDIFRGGAGADRFKINAATDKGFVDWILDFGVGGVNDVIEIDVQDNGNPQTTVDVYGTGAIITYTVGTGTAGNIGWIVVTNTSVATVNANLVFV